MRIPSEEITRKALQKQDKIIAKYNLEKYFHNIKEKWLEGLTASKFRREKIKANTDNKTEKYSDADKEKALNSYEDFKNSKSNNADISNNNFWLTKPKIKYSKYKFDIHKKNNEIITNLNDKTAIDFNLSFPVENHLKAAFESQYCLKCHIRRMDTCRTGISKEKKGCSMDQKISEMISLSSKGEWLAAIIVAMIDNPFLILTGYKICNNCSQACIFQNQEPVDIPFIESTLVKDLLQHPSGIAIYEELFLEKQKTCTSKTRNLIVGCGPAGLSLAYYIAMQGHEATILDAGIFFPLSDSGFNINQPLEARKVDSFGGVMSYGITKRWNKNYIDAMKLLISKVPNIKIINGVKMPQTIDSEQMRNFGFDSLTIATGAGTVETLNIDGIDLINQRYISSDLLMRINLNNDWSNKEISDIEIEMPVVIIGGGLTSLDVATEIKTYYLKQIQYIYNSCQQNLNTILSSLPADRITVLKKYIKDYEYFIKANDKSKALSEITKITIINRSAIEESKAHRLNHEELRDSLAQKICWIEKTEIKEFIAAKKTTMAHLSNGNYLHCNTVVFANGTQENKSFAEDKNIVFKNNCLNIEPDGFTNNTKDGFQIYAIGDANKAYKGSVIEALASGKKLSNTLIKNSIKYNSEKNYKYNAKNFIDLINFPILNVSIINNQYIYIATHNERKDILSGDTFKISSMGKNIIHSIVATAIKQNNAIYFLIKKSKQSSFLFTSKKDQIKISGFNKTSLSRAGKKTTKIFSGSNLAIASLSHALSIEKKVTIFTTLEGIKNFKIIIDIIKDQINLNNIDIQLAKEKQNNDCDVVFDDNDQELHHDQIQYSLMGSNCMIGGVCGKCLIENSNGKFFACQKKFFHNKSEPFSKTSKIMKICKLI